MTSSFVVPDSRIMIIPNDGISNDMIDGLISDAKDTKKRDWFNERFYFCLPIVIGNQYGYVIRAQRGFSVTWNGGEDTSDLRVSELPFPINKRSQAYISNFGSGILTIQNFWHMRTPPGVNTMVISPPNYIKDNVTFMTAVVETDNLRRGFTFNLKLNSPGTVNFEAGEVIGAFINIPRYFVDSFSISYADSLITQDQINEEHDSIREFDNQRTGEDMSKPLQSGRKYFKGEDAWGNTFPDHQQKI
jgi:hypothetical protein